MGRLFRSSILASISVLLALVGAVDQRRQRPRSTNNNIDNNNNRQRQRERQRNNKGNKNRNTIKLSGGGSGDGGLGGLGDLLGALAGAATQKEDGTCPSVCDANPHHKMNTIGSKHRHQHQQHEQQEVLYPVPKRRIQPYSNGCSVPEGMREGLGDYSMFTPW